MKNTKRLLIIPGLVVILGLLSACSQAADEISEPDESAEGDEEETSEAPELEPLMEVQVAELPRPDEACIDCHTNEELLEGLAEEEEEDAEALSSGEG